MILMTTSRPVHLRAPLPFRSMSMQRWHKINTVVGYILLAVPSAFACLALVLTVSAFGVFATLSEVREVLLPVLVTVTPLVGWWYYRRHQPTSGTVWLRWAAAVVVLLLLIFLTGLQQIVLAPVLIVLILEVPRVLAAEWLERRAEARGQEP